MENIREEAQRQLWLAQAMDFVDRFSANQRPRIQVRPETLEQCRVQSEFARDRRYIDTFVEGY